MRKGRKRTTALLTDSPVRAALEEAKQQRGPKPSSKAPRKRLFSPPPPPPQLPLALPLGPLLQEPLLEPPLPPPPPGPLLQEPLPSSADPLFYSGGLRT
ncbi:WAS/WASL-interacting protein family member 3-like [Perca fluviatilis]|uniref:WAS/WASL-interacting protein family member 3-like n=1 Tax=Perca fluviatilis TaxID=8168 RepID=UPI0019659CC1|nr:WAS/WASL-interacting protein family member 3-like [Perca fluviatilis]